MSRRFFTLDVFADRALAGNPLAVVLDSEGLDTHAMQRIAREFNLSETVFVFPPERSENRARIRIFTPGSEMPFAGHPTVGTAVLLATLDHPAGVDDVLFGLEENIGVVPCAVSLRSGKASFARFSVPRLPAEKPFASSAADVARALGIAVGDIGFENHDITIFGTGYDFAFVPVRNRSVLAAIRINTGIWADVFGSGGRGGAFVYARDPENPDHAIRARMFSPGDGIPEDPATGSAVAGLASVMARFDKPTDGKHRFVIEQGFEMGRPSLIELTLDIRHGALQASEIGGQAVIVSEGSLHV